MFTYLLSPQVLAAMLAVTIISSVTYGYAASNTLASSGAGDGEATVSGYTVNNITFTPHAANPDLLNALSFTIISTVSEAPPPSVVKVRFNEAWHNCTLTMSTATCDFSASPIDIDGVDTDAMRIVATAGS